MRVDGWTFGFGLVLASAAFTREGTPSRFNYRDHARPIFVEHCAGCHRPGGVAPMSLLEYCSAVPWAKAMKMQVLDNESRLGFRPKVRILSSHSIAQR